MSIRIKDERRIIYSCDSGSITIVQTGDDPSAAWIDYVAWYQKYDSYVYTDLIKMAELIHHVLSIHWPDTYALPEVRSKALDMLLDATKANELEAAEEHGFEI